MYQLGMQPLRKKELIGDTVFKNGKHDWFRPFISLAEKETLRFWLGKLVSRAIITWQPFPRKSLPSLIAPMAASLKAISLESTPWEAPREWNKHCETRRHHRTAKSTYGPTSLIGLKEKYGYTSWKRFLTFNFRIFRTRISDTSPKRTLSKLTPTKHQLKKNNISENDSFTAASSFYKHTDEEVTKTRSSRYVCQTVPNHKAPHRKENKRFSGA